MIIRKDQPQNDQGTENRAERYGAFALLRYSEVGGLTPVRRLCRAPRDVVHYPELGQVLYNEGDRRRLLRTDGTLVKSGGFSYASGSTLDDL
jgi:hypothetical protein